MSIFNRTTEEVEDDFDSPLAKALRGDNNDTNEPKNED